MRGISNPYRNTIYFLGIHPLAFQLGDHCTKLLKSLFPDSFIAKYLVHMSKVIAKNYWILQLSYNLYSSVSGQNRSVKQQCVIINRLIAPLAAVIHKTLYSYSK